LEASQEARFTKTLMGVMDGSIIPPEYLEDLGVDTKIEVFDVAPEILVRNDLSDEASVIEVSGLDRPGLLYSLTRTLMNMNVSISAARIATFGERAVDVLYAHDLTGGKIISRGKREALVKALTAATHNPVAASRSSRAAQKDKVA